MSTLLRCTVALFSTIGPVWGSTADPAQGPDAIVTGRDPQQQSRQFHIEGKAYSYDYAVIDNAECLSCHASQVDPKEFAESVHGANSCNSCHWEIRDVAAHLKAMSSQGDSVPVPAVKCERCHDEQALEYHGSVHYQTGFGCTTCHSDIHRLNAWKGDKKRAIQTCTGCHPNNDYIRSVHGQAALANNPDAPDCTDCHGVKKSLHKVLLLRGEESDLFHTDECVTCHADRAMMERNHVFPLAVVETYYDGFHGKIEELGYPKLVAGCSDCHGFHNVLPPSDTLSTVSKGRLVETCGSCHPDANARFVEYVPHANYKDPHSRHVFHWAYLFMHGLLISVFAFFWVHTALWWRKDFWETWRRRARGIFYPQRTRFDEAGKIYRRFSLFERTLHFTMITTFMGCVLTGLPLEYPSAPWATGLMRLLGGSPTRGLIHRICAAIMTAVFLAAVVYFVYFLFFKPLPEKPGPLKRLLGPDSLIVRRKDFQDLVAMVRWFFDKGPWPKFDRWTYWEKFDAFAVTWGMFVIGIGGYILWFPTLFTHFLPGWIINVAVIVHSDEALLAAGFIFTIHFFNTHLRPSTFPINTVIFTGRQPQYKMLEEHPAHYERLRREGRLEEYRRRYPSVWLDLFTTIVGFTMLGIGLLCLILIAWKLLG